MAIYDINFFAKVIEWSPPFKRYVINVKWLQSLAKPIQYLRDKILGDYRTGSAYPQWVAATYAKGDKIIHKQVVYESLEDANADTPPSIKWVKFLPSFIGVDKRVKFNGQKLVLEYALNQYFFTSFRQPPLVSDIYIDLLPKEAVGFLVGQTIGSTVAQNNYDDEAEWSIGSYSQYDLVQHLNRMYQSLINANTDEPPSVNWHQTDTVGYSFTFLQLHNFQINVPSAVYYSSLPYAPTISSELRQFVDKIIPAGLNYTIIPY